MVGLVFFASGWKDISDLEARSKSIEINRGFTLFLGIVECAGALGVIAGVLTQLAAIGLVLIMTVAIQRKSSHGTPGSGENTARTVGVTNLC